ncbi:MAG TPA: hypothetical protein VGT99_02390 [Gammaproteobacteria bacterium]|nr:hypothetical protein [Gammaproteobacteria bacterium]
MQIPRRVALCLTFATGLGCTGTAFAGYGCYDTSLYPAVYELSETQGQLRALLGHPADEPRQPDMTIDRYASRTADGGWQLKSRLCTGQDSRCGAAFILNAGCNQTIPVPDLPWAEFQKLAPDLAKSMQEGSEEDGEEDADSSDNATAPRTPQDLKQAAGSCFAAGDAVWFGLTFSCGEGMGCGVGGLGRYDTHTGKVEMRYPAAFVGYSLAPLAFDGRYLWFGTFSSSDCIGFDPGIGLIRYDWKLQTYVSFGGGTDSEHDPGGPCGIEFNDLYVTKEGLWASSDMGLAFLPNPQDDPRKLHWVNYRPDTKDPKQPLKVTTCSAVYSHLLDTLPRHDMNSAEEFTSHYDQFVTTLRHLNPDLMAELTKQP